MIVAVSVFACTAYSPVGSTGVWIGKAPIGPVTAPVVDDAELRPSFHDFRRPAQSGGPTRDYDSARRRLAAGVPFPLLRVGQLVATWRSRSAQLLRSVLRKPARQ